MANSSNCKHSNYSEESASLQTCSACKDIIYGGEGSQLKCNCNKYFHVFCLQNPPPSVRFRFGGTEQILSLNRDITAKAKCKACGSTMTGSRYTHSSGNYSVHPECAIVLVPSQINAGKDTLPRPFSDFLTRHREAASMDVHLQSCLPAGASCMICNHSDDGACSTAKWSYVIMQNGQQLGGCHVTCVRAQLISPSTTEIVNLEKYYKSLATSDDTTENIVEAVTQFLEPLIDNTVQFPFNKIIICAIKFLAAYKVRRYPTARG